MHAKFAISRPVGLKIKKLKMFSNGGYDVVIAETLKEAKKIVRDMSGCIDSEIEGDGWFCYSPDDDFTLTIERLKPIVVNGEEVWTAETTKTVKEWIDSHGKGWFSTTEW